MKGGCLKNQVEDSDKFYVTSKCEWEIAQKIVTMGFQVYDITMHLNEIPRTQTQSVFIILFQSRYQKRN